MYSIEIQIFYHSYSSPSVHAVEGAPRQGSQQSPCPLGIWPALPRAAPGGPARPAGGSGLSSHRIRCFCPGQPEWVRLQWASFKHGVSISYNPMTFLKVNSAGFRDKQSGGSTSQCGNSAEEPSVEVRPLVRGGSSVITIVLWIWGRSPRALGLDSTPAPPLLSSLLWLLVYTFSYRRSILVGSSLSHQQLFCKMYLCVPERRCEFSVFLLHHPGNSASLKN